MNPPIRNLVLDAWQDLHDVTVVWQLGAILLAFAIAWLVNRLARLERIEANGAWGFGIGGLRRILAPVVALVVVMLSRTLLERHVRVHVDVLHLMVPLLGSLALVRIFFYALRYVLPPGGALFAFERAFATIVWLAFALYITGALPDVIDTLDEAAVMIGHQRVSLWLVLQALFWTVVALLGALWAGSAIEARLMRAEGLDSSLRVAASRLAKSLLLFVALLVMLPLVGIDLTVLSVFGGALGVGLGFGLQKIASNYVSGFIILLDRSVRIGDMITVDGFSGRVKQITTRYVVVDALDGREAVIPNDTLITSTVLNQTRSDEDVKLAVTVSVPFESDIERAMRLLAEVAGRQPAVLKRPEPSILALRFSDSGVELELGVWVRGPGNAGPVRSQLLVEIWRTLRREGIDIAYPRRAIVAAAPGQAASV